MIVPKRTLSWVGKHTRRLAKRQYSPLFDEQFYLGRYPDVNISSIDAYDHFIRFGVKENRQPNRLFDPHYYLRQTLDNPKDPTIHFLKVGTAIGLDPHPQFMTSWYKRRYLDVARARVNPLLHFLKRGHAENRQICPSWRQTFGADTRKLLLPRHGGSQIVKLGPVRNVRGELYTDKVVISAQLSDTERLAFQNGFSASLLKSQPNVSIVSNRLIDDYNEDITDLMVFFECFICKKNRNFEYMNYAQVILINVLFENPRMVSIHPAGSIEFP